MERLECMPDSNIDLEVRDLQHLFILNAGRVYVDSAERICNSSTGAEKKEVSSVYACHDYLLHLNLDGAGCLCAFAFCIDNGNGISCALSRYGICFIP